MTAVSPSASDAITIGTATGTLYGQVPAGFPRGYGVPSPGDLAPLERGDPVRIHVGCYMGRERAGIAACVSVVVDPLAVANAIRDPRLDALSDEARAAYREAAARHQVGVVWVEARSDTERTLRDCMWRARMAPR